MRISYKQIQSAYRYQNFLSDDHTFIHYDNISHYEYLLPTQQSVIIYLLNQFRVSNYSEFESVLTKHFAYITSHKNGLRFAREFTLELLESIGSESSRQGVEIDKAAAFPALLSELFSLKEPQDMLARLLQIIRQLMDQRSSCDNYLISRTKAYMKEKLQDQGLCLDSESSHVGLSRVYLCNLFHK